MPTSNNGHRGDGRRGPVDDRWLREETAATVNRLMAAVRALAARVPDGEDRVEEIRAEAMTLHLLALAQGSAIARC